MTNKSASDPRHAPAVLVADDWRDYALLDSGDGRKLERYGAIVVDRPDPQAFWPKNLPPQKWHAHAAFAGGDDSDESGRWRHDKPIPESWPMQWEGLRLNARLSAFRHLGVFPEHSVHWRWAREQIAGISEPRVLNLFGYTGMASLALAKAGATVTHVDASKKSIAWGRENQAASGLESAPIRWICDDALTFVRRELRRGKSYHGIILDPPKHGRGPNGEVFELSAALPELLEDCSRLLAPDARFMIATIYAVRMSFLAIHQGLDAALASANAPQGAIESGEMTLPEQSAGRLLPTAIFARWKAL
ncbi:MAG: class I SAM-dependent methyltransferase [Caulobacterales bacterium]